MHELLTRNFFKKLEIKLEEKWFFLYFRVQQIFDNGEANKDFSCELQNHEIYVHIHIVNRSTHRNTYSRLKLCEQAFWSVLLRLLLTPLSGPGRENSSRASVCPPKATRVFGISQRAWRRIICIPRLRAGAVSSICNNSKTKQGSIYDTHLPRASFEKAVAAPNRVF